MRTDPTAPTVSRHFTRKDRDPFDDLAWQRRRARIADGDGKTLFEQANVEFPDFWSDLAANVVAARYFRGAPGSEQREDSLKTMLSRVTDTLADWGRADGYFACGDDRDAFEAELRHVLVHQAAAFNSPVWFNIGVAGRSPQASACFILSVRDSMRHILDWYRREGIIFKGGSGAGVNLSALRAAGEPLSGGGSASGPLSFMKAADASAGAIKSGGTTRRSAKMVLLDADHPDIEAFIDCKRREEKKAHLLIDAGYDASLDGDAYATVAFQNANHSVRASDAFMQAAVADAAWETRCRTTGQVAATRPARRLLRRIAAAAWACGDPGMQFDDTINAWHTCPQAGRQHATNPCSEYCWIDDSACNLASLNLTAFLAADGTFNVEDFRRTVHLMIVAQDILVSHAAYPTEAIARNSHAYRTLGLGYANLGALLMALGLPYDSDAGRAYAAALTALMTGQAYLSSAALAARLGAFAGHRPNRDAMLGVIDRHAEHALELITQPRHHHLPDPLRDAVHDAWSACRRHGAAHGFRNAQVTLLAPTGTIAFMMDCDTTGVEPDLALVKHKRLAGGGRLDIVNTTVPRALARLGYAPAARAAIIRHIGATGSAEGAADLDADHLAVFDCAFPATPGGRAIACSGHLQMVAAVQPFLSGAVSKTINLPANATVDDIERTYIDAWRAGIKCVAVYRDGCKRVQPLSTAAQRAAGEPPPRPARRHMPDERTSITHKFSIAGHEGYLTVGMFEDGSPGEIFLVMSKEGSTISGLMDAFATSISMALQYGVPLPTLIDKFSHMRFEPAGFTRNPDIPMAKSVMDYIFRWLAAKFLDRQQQDQVGIVNRHDGEPANGDRPAPDTFSRTDDAPPCADCGTLMVRNGTCYKCRNCGATSGCS